MSDIVNTPSDNVVIDQPQTIEATKPDGKPKYRKPYVMTEARKKSVQKMIEARRQQLESKTDKKVQLEQELKTVQEKLSKLEKTMTPVDNEIHITKPVRVEKKPKKDKEDYISPETQQIMVEQGLPVKPVVVERPKFSMFGLEI